MRLVIAEKPSVAQSIAAVLGAKSRHDGYLEGGGYIVSWCFGHLAELADAAVYNADDAKWTLAALPIIPTSFRFIVRSEKQKQFDILRELVRREDVAEVVNACDAGREGELIFRTVYCLAGCSKPILRLWISSMEDDAIRSGFQQLTLRATAPTSTPPLSQAKPSMSIAPRLKPPSVAALTSLSRSLPRVRAQPRN